MLVFGGNRFWVLLCFTRFQHFFPPLPTIQLHATRGTDWLFESCHVHAAECISRKAELLFASQAFGSFFSAASAETIMVT